MAEERVACKTEGCVNSIQTATARRNDGYCGVCFNRIAQEKRRAFIEKNRRDVDLYQGASDPVDLLLIYHQPRSYDQLNRYVDPPRTVEELYTSLTPMQRDRMIEYAVKAIAEGDNNIAENIALCLAAFTTTCLDPLLSEFVARDRYWPPLAFRNADDCFTHALIDALATNGPADKILQSLAWIGTTQVARFFAESDAQPPPWAGSLHQSPSRYANVAGWELRDGRRHDLHFDQCYAMDASSESDVEAISVSAMRSSNSNCSWCQRPLRQLVQFDLADARLHFLAAHQSPLSVYTCEVCTCFTGDGGPFFRATAHGRWAWAPQNQKPEYLPSAAEDWGSSPWSEVPVTIRHRRAWHAADQFIPTTFSQIGGLPTWINDPVYPTCVECGRTMTFIAQLDNGAFLTHEGMYYAFLCSECGVTATAYQQT
ncbi:MAG: hypothetical protein AAF432_14400 [Planctomycetota bacterium]